MKKFTILTAAIAMLVMVTTYGCTNAPAESIMIDGSSTVYPITEAVAEEFSKIEKDIRVTVGVSGTGGGFKKFLALETDINDASRPIKGKEIKKAKEAGIGFIVMPVAFDGISIAVNPKNTFVDYLTTKELKKIWNPESTVKNWSDVRKGWPKKPISLYGPGTDSGTFDYFTKKINDKEQASRSDYTASATPNVLVQGIASDENALGYFGYAYYAENKDKLRLIPVKKGDGPAVAPNATTINNGTYTPLSRPIFIYVSSKSAKRPAVKKFVNFYMDNAAEMAKAVGYVALPSAVYGINKSRFANGVTGSVFSGKKTAAKSLEELLK